MPGNNNNNNKNQQQKLNELKNLVNNLQKKVEVLENNNVVLERRVENLEEKHVISTHVTDLLTAEVDRLSQYIRRSNVVVKGVFLPEKESKEDVEKKVCDLAKNEMGIPDILGDFDKAHRIGKVKIINGKKHQDIIVKFKSHAARYKFLNHKKSLKNNKVHSYLTPKRSKLLFDARSVIERFDRVHFVFADIHGDLKLRLRNNPYKEKYVFDFDSIDSLNGLLKEIGITDN